ncbi:MAG: sensor histidine kinase [Aestuariivirga sp.]
MDDSNSSRTSKSWFAISLPALLVFLSLASVVPLIAFSVFSLRQLDERASAFDEERIVGHTRNVSSNIDREIASLVAAASTLATSPSIARGDFHMFYDEAKLSMNYAQANVLLLDLSLQQLVNTRVAYGTALPKTSNPANALRVIDTRKYDVSDIFVGKVAKTRVFNVTVPVIIEGSVRHVLIVAAEPGRVKSVLDQYWLPEGWHVAVSDKTGAAFASSSPDAEGQGVGLSLLEIGAQDGTAIKTEVLGQPSVMSFQKSSTTGWTAMVWAPDVALDAPLAATWRNLYAGSLLAIALSVIFAYLFQLPLANLIRQTLAAVGQVGKPAPIPEIRTVLAEGVAIQRSLAAADAELRERRREAEEGKALLDTLLEHVPEGITIVGGPEFRVIANSRKAAEMAGRAPEALGVLASEHAETFGVWFPDGITRPDVTQLPLYRASRLGESISEEIFLIRRPDGSEITIEAAVNPVRDAHGKIIGAISCWRDVTDRFVAERAIADNERRLRLALNAAGMAIIDIDLRKGVIAGITSGSTYLGLEVDAGEPIASALPKLRRSIHPDDRARVEANQNAAITTAGAFSDEFRIFRPDGSVAWVETRGEAIADKNGNVIRLLGTNADITARKRADEHLQLVLRELTHRAKNLLAVILAIATQTARRNTTVEDFLTAFSRRIQGLGASHDLLVKRDWTGVPLDELVHAQLAPFGRVDGRRIAASGPPVTLKADVLQSLGLALHELATNATKYGALSDPEGTVEIAWSMEGTGPDARFRMSWTERGGPRVKPPRSKGFGHVIIESSFAKVINGDVKLNFAPEGIAWSLNAPADAITPAP